MEVILTKTIKIYEKAAEIVYNGEIQPKAVLGLLPVPHRSVCMNV